MIGVSNFLQQDIESLLETANVKPMVNQVLCHISNTPLSLIDYCQRRGIAVEAYSPIAHGEALKIAKIDEMAKKYGVTVPQLWYNRDSENCESGTYYSEAGFTAYWFFQLRGDRL